MKLRRFLFLAGIAGTGIGLSLGCSSVDQINDPDPAFETLTVAYGDPGIDPDPCNDALPVIDGVATDQEWSSAEPLFVRMSGENGSGGADFFLEVRAIWTDESKVGGKDRIYFLIRYPDAELNAQPDALGFMQPLGSGEYCENLVQVNNQFYCPSPPPVYDVNRPGSRCDPALIQPGSWTRVNRNGQEDQVFVTFTQTDGPDALTNLTDVNGIILGNLGPEVPSGVQVPLMTGPLDIWAWRAGRTNLHPVYQFPRWSDINEFGFPVNEYEPFFEFQCGFCEDLYVGSNGVVVRDAGRVPYVKNFGRLDPVTQEVLTDVPIRSTECPPTGREPSEEDLASLNGGVPKDLGMWWPDASGLGVCDTLACTRSGIPPKWSTRLVPGEFDRVPGWGLQLPGGTSTSSRDVRAKGTHEATQEKGFAVRTLEIMRDMDTLNGDDLVITPNGNQAKEYRMVIGVLNNSSRVGSGSTEIRLRFEAPKPRSGSVDRC